MKAEELMIGDWVKLKDAKLGNINFVGPTVQIKSITGRHVLVPNAKGLLEDVTEEYLLPIELTPEILEKNGFKKKEPQDIWTFYTDNYGILWPTDDNNTLAINSYFAKYGIFSKQHIDYIHQLQHALQLCGINKEIKLSV